MRSNDATKNPPEPQAISITLSFAVTSINSAQYFVIWRGVKTIPNEYDVILNVVVSGNLASLLATRERYEKEILKSDKQKRIERIKLLSKIKPKKMQEKSRD